MYNIHIRFTLLCAAAFCTLTKYSKAEVENRNCRFLQGPETQKEDVDKIRSAITNKQSGLHFLKISVSSQIGHILL